MDRAYLQIVRIGWLLGLAGTFWCGTALVPPVAASSGSVEAGVVAPAAAAENSAAAHEKKEDPALADGLEEETAPTLPDEGDGEASYFGVMVKLGLGLGLVVLLVWGAVFVLRRSALGQQFGAAGGLIHVAERAYLGPKKAICLVEIGDRTLALGITEETITALAEWRTGELNLGPREEPPDTLASQFRNLLGQVRPAGPAEGGKA